MNKLAAKHVYGYYQTTKVLVCYIADIISGFSHIADIRLLLVNFIYNT